MSPRSAIFSGTILQLLLGFGIGTSAGNGGVAANAGKLDFSRTADSGLIVALRRF